MVQEIPKQTVMCAVVVIFAMMMQNTAATPDEEEQVQGYTYSERCDGQADVLFVVDSSTSVKAPEYEQAKKFIASIVAAFKIGPGDMQFASIVYSNYTRIGFHYNAYKSRPLLIRAILGLPRLGGKTDTADALYIARTYRFYGLRNNVHRIAIVTTDGKSSDPEKTKKQAKALKAAGVNVIAIGVGHGIDLGELNTIASNPSLVFYKKDYYELVSIWSSLADIICTVCHSNRKVY